MSDDDELRRVAAALNAGPPGGFVAARKAAAEAAPALGARIARLQKPAAAAAAIDALVASDPAPVDALAEVGERLRTAEEEGDASALRSLASERRQAVAAATRATVELLTGAGSSVSGSTREAIDACFQAAVLSPDAFAAVRSGLLVKPLTPGSDPTAAVSLPVDPDAVPSLTATGRDAARREPGARAGASARAAAERKKARAAADRAEREAADAAAALSEAESTLASAQAARDETRARRDALRRELAALDDSASALDDALAEAQSSRRTAATAERAARTRAAALRRKAP